MNKIHVFIFFVFFMKKKKNEEEINIRRGLDFYDLQRQSLSNVIKLRV